MSNSDPNAAAMYQAWTQSYSSHYAQAYQPRPPPSAGPSYYQSPSSTSAGLSHSTRIQPGHVRCNYKTCSFSGSPKTLEIHKLDRHLIYPAGYDEKRKPGNDWDADPSLKGKKIPIQGTNLILDSPDVLEGWIAERKMRWPSASRVEDKKRKLQEAAARGELTPEELGIFSRKRQKTSMNEDVQQGRGRGRGRGRGFERGRGHGRGRGRGAAQNLAPAQAIGFASKDENESSSSLSSDSDNDGEPEVASSKLSEIETGAQPIPLMSAKHPVRLPPQPIPLSQQSSRSGLLRNLLLPEIRMTVSNLSQAIRFLVDNDFLRNVERKPGEADNEMIRVVHEKGAQPSSSLLSE